MNFKNLASSKMYSQPSKTSKMEIFVKIVKWLKPVNLQIKKQ